MKSSRRVSRPPGNPFNRKMLLPLLLVGLLGTAGRRRRAAEPPALVLTAVAQASEDRGAVIAELERYLAGSPNPDIVPWAQVWVGEQRRIAGDLQVARGWFEAAALDHPTHIVKDAAVLGMALVDAEDTLSGNTLATIQLMDPPVCPDTMRADRLRVLARTAANEGTMTRKVREMAVQARDLAKGDAVVEARVELVLADLLVDDQQMGSGPTTGPDGLPLSPEQQALTRARQAMQRHAFEDVIAQADKLVAMAPDSDEATQAGWLKKRAQAKDPTVAGRVGVLLPLSGVFGTPARRIRDAINLANDLAGKPLELVFVDTTADAETAVGQAQDLVLEKGCVALLGPLHRDVVAAVAPIAQGLGVPMIALTQSGDPTSAGPYVFDGFLSVQRQVDALVDFAMENRGLRSFAILHPRNAYGDRARDLFVAAVSARGGTVPQIVPYDPDSHDFREEARLLGQKHGMRPEKGKPDPPLVEFDAIFLPDSFRRATLVASALAYEEFPIGTFRPRFGGPGLPLLGLNGWDNDAVVAEGGRYMRGAIFVDAFQATCHLPPSPAL
ncbi:MAG: ABC transporter substrate-binding protein [Oligoflexia bacterium]|nr:ABC transporter substrate-binding protein [Oligoflexia bacterium]